MTQDARLALADECDKCAAYPMEQMPVYGAQGLLKRAAATLRASQPGTVSREEAWCQPMDCGKHTPRRFMIYFDDPDHGIMVFDNEAEARAAFERKNTAWNCYLFGALPLSLSIPANGRALERLIQTATLLQQNAEGCAVNHHGLDFEQQGLPGWLRDTQSTIVDARQALSALPVKDQGPNSFGLCDDCPPVGYPTGKTRCSECPRAVTADDGAKS